MEKKTLLALAICFIIIGVYPSVLRIFYPDFGKPAEPVVSQAVSSITAQPAPSAFTKESPAPLASAAPQSDSMDAALTPKKFYGPYEVVFSETYGTLSRLWFTGYINHVDEKPLQFLKATEPAWGVGALRLQVNGAEVMPTHYQMTEGPSMWRAEAQTREFKVTKEFGFSKKDYAHGLTVTYTNTSNATQDVSYQVSAGTGLVTKNTIDMQYFEVNWIGEDSIKHLRNGFFSKPVGKGKTQYAEKPYIAVSVKDRHFSSILKPDHVQNFTAGAYGIDDQHPAAFLSRVPVRVAPGESLQDAFLYYAGPNDLKNLEPYGLSEVVHFGKLDGICKFLIGMMQLVQSVSRNYGVAIILLTIGLNLVLFPLTRTSFLSMKRMQLVQPQTVKIREKYKSDPSKMNKEMMELYKKYKINPLGSCLPMTLQMPVFISLYVALSKSTELLDARFLWIKDLASPDRVPLPFSLPLLGNTINVLPLIMVVATVLQQKLAQANMSSADPHVAQQQKIMMFAMPVFFGFLFYPMPSGLVIYWLTNTLVMMGVQFSLRKTTIELKPAR